MVEVPITRSDLFHACDIAEDVLIAYGYNNVENLLPPSMTIGGETRLNKMTDLIREQLAQAGYNECLNFSLSSLADITSKLGQPDTDDIIRVSNPKSVECQVLRSTLKAGLLRTLANNKGHKLPL